MKKTLALFLCFALLLVMPVGCKKKSEEKAELTESTVSADLIRSNHLYHLSHCGAFNSMTGVKIVDKSESGDTASLSVTATALSTSVSMELAAKMKYTYANGHWNMKDIEITKAVPTLIGGPDQESALSEIGNYISIVGNALAVKGETEHMLPAFNLRGGSWEMICEKGAKTAQLNVSYKSDTLTFKGYYTLTYGDTGWRFETKEKDGRNHILLHLESLEQKK